MSDIKVGYDPELEADWNKAIEEFSRGKLSAKSPPERSYCVICFRTIPSWATVCSEACKDELAKRRQEAEKIRTEMEEKFEKLRRDIEHNTHPTTEIIMVTVTGMKKDIERFKDDIKEIVENYKLRHWG